MLKILTSQRAAAFMAILKPMARVKPGLLYKTEPDYTKPPLTVSEEIRESILKRLSFLYGEEKARESLDEIVRIMQTHYSYKTPEMIERETRFSPKERFSERDAILITYPDQVVSEEGEPPLRALVELSARYLRGVFNTIHILPFYPYSSDRGFSVIDYERVEPRFGTWEDILEIKTRFRLMFDLVLNHVSSQSIWFQEFLRQNPEFEDFFISFPSKDSIPKEKLRLITRPRTSELLTPYNTPSGVRYVWTTFSPDQIDLNYKNPRVLERMLAIMLGYVRRGADLIRLDAVTYLWKRLGTTCAHLEETHEIIKIMRCVLDAVAPTVSIVTETNAPHEYNISYFGNGSDEAQMVYNFALPPLVLQAFQKEDATRLNRWAMGLERTKEGTAYLNFLDSHDGIGVMGATGYLSASEIDEMASRVIERGGYISYRDNGDGTKSPYELNITWESALNTDGNGDSRETCINRYLASRSIALALAGVPGVYIHGLLASKNDHDEVKVERQYRGINRGKLEKRCFREVRKEDFPTAYRFVEMIRKRVHEKAFHPNAPQTVLDAGSSFFALLRSSRDFSEHIIAVVNVTSKDRRFVCNPSCFGLARTYWYDLISGAFVVSKGDGEISLTLSPYQVVWLKSI